MQKRWKSSNTENITGVIGRYTENNQVNAGSITAFGKEIHKADSQ